MCRKERSRTNKEMRLPTTMTLACSSQLFRGQAQPHLPSEPRLRACLTFAYEIHWSRRSQAKGRSRSQPASFHQYVAHKTVLGTLSFVSLLRSSLSIITPTTSCLQQDFEVLSQSTCERLLLMFALSNEHLWLDHAGCRRCNKQYHYLLIETSQTKSMCQAFDGFYLGNGLARRQLDYLLSCFC